MVICLERDADLHMAQLMPLPLVVCCFSEILIGFTFLVLAHLGSPGKGPLNGCVQVSKLVSNKCIAVRKVATPLRELTCHMGSHSVTCHPTGDIPALTPAEAGT